MTREQQRDEERFALLDALSTPTFAVTIERDDQFRLVYGNAAYRELIEWPSGDPLPGDLATVVPDATLSTYLDHFTRAAREQTPVSFETDVAGGRRTILVEPSPLAPSLLVAVVHDVTDRRRAQTTLEYNARHDPLTKLPNAVLFDDQLRARAVQRDELEMAMRTALEHNEFRVYYQPVVGFEHTEVIGFEALVRWEHPQRGLLAPGSFLPVAEASGLVVPIGASVLDQACRQAAGWARDSSYDPPLTVSVNLSARQLGSPDLVTSVGGALAAADLAPELLVLEVNERALFDERGPVRGVLYELASLGVRLSVDDFGAGQSSLRYLKTLPVHSLKIARSLVDGLGTDRDDAAVVAAIVSLGHALGLTVAAAGIETPRQLSEVRSLGCDVGQGFYFARPQPGEIVRALVHRRFRWRERDPAA
ncbi:MAG: EAL domain-containing protein [Actinomycetota bacterium]